jgi:hypothetical protein
MEAPDERTHDFRTVPHICGVPRYMFRSAIGHAVRAILQRLRGRAAESFEDQLWLSFFAGVVRQRWSDRQTPIGTVTALDAQP